MIRYPGILLLALAGAASATPKPEEAPKVPGVAADGPSVRLTQVTPAPGSRVTAGTLIVMEYEYSWPRFEKGWDRLTLVQLGRGKDPRALRELPVVQASGRGTIRLMAVEMWGSLNQKSAELHMEMVHVQATSRDRTVVKTSDKALFTGELQEYEGQKLHFLPPSEGRKMISIDPGQEAYRPHLPPALNRDGMVVWGLFRVCVDREARVFNVSALKSADPLVDDDWMAMLRRYPHRPHTIEGVAVPYCYPLRLEVRSKA